jgi:uncharacterized protein YgiM (DUF1202 family)
VDAIALLIQALQDKEAVVKKAKDDLTKYIAAIHSKEEWVKDSLLELHRCKVIDGKMIGTYKQISVVRNSQAKVTINVDEAMMKDWVENDNPLCRFVETDVKVTYKLNRELVLNDPHELIALGLVEIERGEHIRIKDAT